MRSNGDSSTSWRHTSRARRLGLHAGVVRAHGLALRRGEHLRPRLRGGLLHPRHAGPPARQAGRVADHAARPPRRARHRPSRAARSLRVVDDAGCARRSPRAARGPSGRPARSRTRIPPRRRPPAPPARTAPPAVPPVASRSSCTSTRAPPAHGVGVHLEGVHAVLELVLDRGRLARQLAGLARRG